jgi:hypothetical protein
MEMLGDEAKASPRRRNLPSLSAVAAAALHAFATVGAWSSGSFTIVEARNRKMPAFQKWLALSTYRAAVAGSGFSEKRRTVAAGSVPRRRSISI